MRSGHPTPRIFVSQSSGDDDFELQLVADLRTALGGEDAAVWYDRSKGLQGIGASWRKIKRAISARSVFIVVLSAAAVASPRVNAEIELAEQPQKYTPAGIRIIPLLRQQCSVPSSLQGIPIISFEPHRPYAEALAELLTVLDLPRPATSGSMSGKHGPHRRLRPVPGKLAPGIVPENLQQLGYVGRTINGVEVILPPLCTVPAGPFTMGSDKAHDPNAMDDETPQHVVEVDGFQIARFPVTDAEYDCWVRHSGLALGADRIWGHPLVSVTWNNATHYAEWVAFMTGMPWRLPTEAEWEKAARGTDARIYPWGDRWDEKVVKVTTGLDWPYGEEHRPTGATPYGAQRMAGNVWEWTSSRYKPYPYHRNDGREEVESIEAQDDLRVRRGGSAGDRVAEARSARREASFPWEKVKRCGLRLVLAAPAEAYAYAAASEGRWWSSVFG